MARPTRKQQDSFASALDKIQLHRERVGDVRASEDFNKLLRKLSRRK